jgi:hypothetical protein
MSQIQDNSIRKIIPVNRTGRFKDLTGQKFGRLYVIKIYGRNKSGSVLWLCRCDCGQYTRSNGCNLRSGGSKSCGCLHREIVRNSPTRFKAIHGMSGKSEAWIFNSMKQRCLNPKNDKYKDYGGRGIDVCRRWINGSVGKSGFQCFLEDMGLRPSKFHSIGRKDNNKGYSPENCKWETPQQQSRNKRTTVFLVIHGEKISVPDAASKYNLSARLIRERIKRIGWTHEMAVGLK